MGRNHLRVLSGLEGATLAAVCDQDPQAVAASAKQYHVLGYGSWEEMVGRERLDAVVVAVPTRFHHQVVLGALDSGIHVLVEKPIATNLEEARELVSRADRAGLVLAVGHVERFNPAVRELQKRLGAGEIGRLFQVQARRQGPFPARIRDVGVVIDLATHDLDVMSHIAGSQVNRVYAETERRIHTEHEDILNALLKFESGMLGVLQVNWLTPTKIRELSVLGEKGLFICNYLTQELTYFRNADVKPGGAGALHPYGVSEGDMRRYPVAQSEPLQLELESFLHAVGGNGPIEVDGEAGLRALHLALALIESATSSRVLGQDELRALWGSTSSSD
jgi:predicted dehydrogenase